MESNTEIVDFGKLDVYQLKGVMRDNPLELHDVYKKSFFCWHETWNDYFHQEHITNVKLASTEFTRQDDILALFYKGECFGISFFKEVDWDDPTARLDSYFSSWPATALDGLAQRGKKILICSQFTVAKDFRNKKTDIAWKYILCGLIMTRFLNSTAHAMTGTMRVSKGMGKVAVSAGAIPLITNLKCEDHENELVDLVAFFQEEVLSNYLKNPYGAKLDTAWEERNGRLYSQLRLVA